MQFWKLENFFFEEAPDTTMTWKYELYQTRKGLLHYLITWKNANAVFHFWKQQILFSEKQVYCFWLDRYAVLCEVLAFSDRSLTQIWFLLDSFFPLWNTFIAIWSFSIITCAKQIFPATLGTASDTETGAAIHIHNTLHWNLRCKSIHELENQN